MDDGGVGTDEKKPVGPNPSSTKFAEVGPGGVVRDRLCSIISMYWKKTRQLVGEKNECGYKVGEGGDRKKDSFIRKDVFYFESIKNDEMCVGLIVTGSGETLDQIKAELYVRLRPDTVKKMNNISTINITENCVMFSTDPAMIGINLPIHIDNSLPIENKKLLPFLLNGGDGGELEKSLATLIKAVMTELTIIFRCLWGIITHTHMLNFKIAIPGSQEKSKDGATLIYSLWIMSHDIKSTITFHRDVVLQIVSYDRQGDKFAVSLDKTKPKVANLQTIAPMITKALQSYTLESSALEIVEQRIDRLLEFND